VVFVFNYDTGDTMKATACKLNTLVTMLQDQGLYTGSAGSSDHTGAGSGSNSGTGTSITLTYDSSIDSAEWEVLRLTNQHRMSLGLSPLSTTDDMQKAANQRASELPVLFNADHQRPDGSECFTVLDDYRISYRSAGENIASGYRTAAAVVNGWLNSSGHRANIETSSFTHMGVGMDSFYWSQDFIGGACSYSGLSLSQYSVSGKVGQDLDELLAEADIAVTASCAQHGSSYLPLIAAMCSGYDASAVGTQTVTAYLGSSSATLSITLSADCTGHVYDEGQITQAASCTQEGVMTYTCLNCGQAKTESIPKIDHVYDEGQVTQEASCTEEGVLTYTCTLCGETKTESIAQTDHVYRSGVCVNCGQSADSDTDSSDQGTDEADGSGQQTLPFQDIAGHWAVEGITYAYENGLFSGTSETTFAPNDLMTRAMVVTVLARYAGVDTSDGETWYAKGRQWAIAQKVSDGSDMMGSITREQLAAMLYRYAGFPTPTGDLSQFPDASNVSSYAVDALRWAVGQGLINGMNGSLNPQGNATRAQVATIMMRFCES
jgi:uncharacterized protein YkwD